MTACVDLDQSRVLFNQHPISLVLDRRFDPWFHAFDVCKAFDMTSPRRMVSRHVSILEKIPYDFIAPEVLPDIAIPPKTTFLNEKGVLSLLFKVPEPLKELGIRWLTSDVMPVLRQKAADDMGETYLKVFENLSQRAVLSNQLNEAYEAMQIYQRDIEDLNDNLDMLTLELQNCKNNNKELQNKLAMVMCRSPLKNT